MTVKTLLKNEWWLGCGLTQREYQFLHLVFTVVGADNIYGWLLSRKGAIATHHYLQGRRPSECWKLAYSTRGIMYKDRV